MSAYYGSFADHWFSVVFLTVIFVLLVLNMRRPSRRAPEGVTPHASPGARRDGATSMHQCPPRFGAFSSTCEQRPSFARDPREATAPSH